MNGAMHVRCKDCYFEEVVSVQGDDNPADVVRSHGKETGHTLNLSRVE